jgi:heptosyltransferase-2
LPKFLIIRFSSIGDIVLTSPVVRCLKQQVPNAEIHFLVKEQFRSLVEHNPYIDKIQVLAHSWELMMEELASENYDYIIDLHHNIRTLKIKQALKKKAFSFKKLNVEKYIYTTIKVNLLPKIHIVDRYLKTVESFCVKNDGAGLDFFIGAPNEIKKADIPVSHSLGYIACVIGAAHATKRWPVHKWKAFCKEINHPVILLGGKEDAENGRQIAAIDDVKIYNACGKFNLNESADIIRTAKVVISNDTGLMHIAAAFKKPIISLWGNTVPSFGMTPYYGNAAVHTFQMQVSKLRCRPCSKIGYDKCPKGHFKCMENILEKDVLERVRQLI